MPTCEVFTDAFGRFHTACGPGPLVVAPPELNDWYTSFLTALAGGQTAQALWIGDSMLEGFTADEYRLRAIDQVRRRVQGSTPLSVGFLPAGANLGSTLTDVTWPGGDSPWTVTGSPTADLARGFGLHAVSIPVGAALQTSFFGTGLALYFTGTAAGATAAAIRVDGTVVGTLDARDSPAVPGKVGAATNLTYGHHTVRFEPNDGPLVLEGVTLGDTDASLFGFLQSVVFLDGTHAGLSTPFWSDPGATGNDWSAGLQPVAAQVRLLVVGLGRNDQQQGGLAPATFRDNLVTIMQRVEARVSHDVATLLVVLPGVTDEAYVVAAHEAAALVGADHVVVLDVAGSFPGRVWPADLTDDDVHPNQAGHDYLGELLGRVVAPVPPSAVPTTPDPFTFRAQDAPLARVNWAQNLVDLGGGDQYDQSPAGTTLGERRQRHWLDPGTYDVSLTYHRDAGLGSLEVLAGTWQKNTPTLTSLGTVATAGATGLVTVALAQVTTSVPAFVPTYVRKTTAAGAVRFVRLVFDRV